MLQKASMRPLGSRTHQRAIGSWIGVVARMAIEPSPSALVNVRRSDGFWFDARSRYLISPSMVSASQLCPVAKLVIGKGCAGPGTNF